MIVNRILKLKMDVMFHFQFDDSRGQNLNAEKFAQEIWPFYIRKYDL